VRQHHAIAVAPEPRRDIDPPLQPARAKRQTHRHQPKQMRPVQRAEGQLVTQAGPGAFAREHHPHPGGREEAERIRHHKRRCVGQRDIADAKDGQRHAGRFQDALRPDREPPLARA
jgi:hypothetical protein